MSLIHAKYSPSRLNMLAECPGFVSGPSSPAAERGTLTHDTIHRMIEGRSVPKDRDPEVIEMAEKAVAYFEQLKEQHPGMKWYPEQRVSTGIHDVWGISDLIGHDEFSGELKVLDWKTGRGMRADAATSWQMLAYAAGALHSYPADYVNIQIIELETGDSTQIKCEAKQAPEWLDGIKRIIEKTEKSTEDDYWPFYGCKYCGRDACPKLRALAVTTGESLPSLPPVPAEIAPEDLAPLMDKLIPAFDLIDAYIGKLKARAMQVIEAGGEIPGWHVAERAGFRKWKDEETAKKELPKEIQHEIFKLMSPADVEKRLIELAGMKKKEAAALLKPLTTQGVTRSLKPIKQIEEAA